MPRRIRKVVEGEPRLLVRDGLVLAKAIKEERVDVEDVRAAARGVGVARLEDVRFAVLETDGSISIIPIEGHALQTSEKPSAT